MNIINKKLFLPNVEYKGVPGTRGDSVIIRVPGSSGHGWPLQMKYFAETNFFWLHGFNAYLYTAPGADNHDGKFSPKNSINFLEKTIKEFRDNYGFRNFYITSTCSGGIVSAYTSLKFQDEIKGLIIYDSALEYSEKDWEDFIERKKELVNIADFTYFKDDFMQYNLKYIIDKITIPVLYAYGDELSDWTRDAVQKIKSLSNFELFHIPGGTHSIGKNNFANINKLLSHSMNWINKL